jgi:hypothetical protein
MTGRINTFRNAVIAAIRATLPAARTIEPQFGRFDLDELGRTSFKAPAIRVAVLMGKVPATPSGQNEASLQCAAFVVTDGKDRDEAGWDMAEAIATLLHSGQMWGLTKLSAPDRVSIQPVVSASIRDRGVAIIAVEWSQAVRNLGANLFDEQGVLLEELYVNGEEIELPGGTDA